MCLWVRLCSHLVILLYIQHLFSGTQPSCLCDALTKAGEMIFLLFTFCNCLIYTILMGMMLVRSEFKILELIEQIYYWNVTYYIVIEFFSGSLSKKKKCHLIMMPPGFTVLTSRKWLWWYSIDEKPITRILGDAASRSQTIHRCSCSIQRQQKNSAQSRSRIDFSLDDSIETNIIILFNVPVE